VIIIRAMLGLRQSTWKDATHNEVEMSKGRQTEDAWLKRGETEIVPVIILELQHPTLGTKVQISNLQLIS
jgi:hypothetical protein